MFTFSKIITFFGRLRYVDSSSVYVGEDKLGSGTEAQMYILPDLSDGA